MATETAYRGWVNQPSRNQPHHDLHGTKCIVQDSGESTVRVWFVEGPIHSMMMSRLAITRLYISKAG